MKKRATTLSLSPSTRATLKKVGPMRASGYIDALVADAAREWQAALRKAQQSGLGAPEIRLAIEALAPVSSPRGDSIVRHLEGSLEAALVDRVSDDPVLEASLVTLAMEYNRSNEALAKEIERTQ